MLRSSALVLVSAAALVCSACFMPPPSRDPLEGPATPTASTELKNLTMGLVVSQNTLDAIKYANHVDAQYMDFVKPLPDLNEAIAKYITFLQSNFKWVVRVDKETGANVDVVGVLDMHIDHLAATVFEHDEFTMKTVFLTPGHEQLGEANGHWARGGTRTART